MPSECAADEQVNGQKVTVLMQLSNTARLILCQRQSLNGPRRVPHLSLCASELQGKRNKAAAVPEEVSPKCNKADVRSEHVCI